MHSFSSPGFLEALEAKLQGCKGLRGGGRASGANEYFIVHLLRIERFTRSDGVAFRACDVSDTVHEKHGAWSGV